MMNDRRKFLQGTALTLLGGVASLRGLAEDRPAYIEATQGIPGNKADIVNFFWYRCPHCYRMDALIHRWQEQHPGVSVENFPAVVRGSWLRDARAYYTARKLGVSKGLHKIIFEAGFERGLDTSDQQVLTQLFQQLSISSKRFTATFNSPGIREQAVIAAETTRKVGIQGVPALLVKNRWITTTSMAGGQAPALQIALDLLKA